MTPSTTDQAGPPDVLLEAKAALEWRGNLDNDLRCLDAWTFAKIRREEQALEALVTEHASLRVRYDQQERRAEETVLTFGEIEHLIEHEYRLKHHSLDLVLNTILDVARSARAALAETETERSENVAT